MDKSDLTVGHSFTRLVNKHDVYSLVLSYFRRQVLKTRLGSVQLLRSLHSLLLLVNVCVMSIRTSLILGDCARRQLIERLLSHSMHSDVA